MTEISKEQMLLELFESYYQGKWMCEAVYNELKGLIESSGEQAKPEKPASLTEERKREAVQGDPGWHPKAPPAGGVEEWFCDLCEFAGMDSEEDLRFQFAIMSLLSAPPAPKVEPEVDNSGHPQAEERRETARAVKEAFASQREWADKWRGQDNPALEPKSDSYYETVRDRAVALILSPPAKEGVSVTSEEITSLANDLAKDTWLGRCQILEKWLRSIGIRVVEPSEAEDSEEGKEPK